MAKDRNLALRILSRKELPLLRIITGAAVIYLFWLLWIGGVFRTEARSMAEINEERMTRLRMAVRTYFWANRSLPPALGALVCAERDKNSCIPFAAPELMRDVWGTPYIYQASGKSFALKCLGADKREGGGGPDADITLAGY